MFRDNNLRSECSPECGSFRARVKRHANSMRDSSLLPEADGRKDGAGHAAASPFGRIAAIGGDSLSPFGRIAAIGGDSLRQHPRRLWL
jgi:hypothetical protein